MCLRLCPCLLSAFVPVSVSMAGCVWGCLCIVVVNQLFVFPQDILEKFEFFPIKCRIQRALEVYQVHCQRLAKATYFKYKTKVRSPGRLEKD